MMLNKSHLMRLKAKAKYLISSANLKRNSQVYHKMWPLMFQNICVDVKMNSLILAMIVDGHIIILHLSTDIYKKPTELSDEWPRKVFNRSLIGALSLARNEIFKYLQSNGTQNRPSLNQGCHWKILGNRQLAAGCLWKSKALPKP